MPAPTPAPEDVGRHFRIPPRRRDDAPLGKPDEFDDVIQRHLERGGQRQVPAPPPRRR